MDTPRRGRGSSSPPAGPRSPRSRPACPRTAATAACPGCAARRSPLLAGVSVDYYTRLERGNLAGVSDSVLEALARALQLDEAERAHLFDLARAANASPAARCRRPAPQRGPPRRAADARRDDRGAGVRRATRDSTSSPPTRSAARSTRRCSTSPARRPNSARFTFLDPPLGRLLPRLGRKAPATRRRRPARRGRPQPYDKRLTDLIGELSTRSEEFRTLWAAHDVRLHRTGIKRLHHPVVGDMTLAYEALNCPPTTDCALNAYTAEPGSPSADALNLLASWAASSTEEAGTPDRPGRAPAG